MKIRLKAIMLVGLLVLLVPLLLGYVTGSLGASHTNYVTTHAATNKAYTNSNCVACHTTLTETSRDTEGGNNIGAHRRHFLSVFLNFANNYSAAPVTNPTSGCVHCHEATIFDGDGASNAWTSGSGSTLGFGHGLEGDLSGITTLTVGVALETTATARKNVNPLICRDCHGSWSQSPSHPATIGAAAECAAATCHVGTLSATQKHASSNPSTSTIGPSGLASGVWGIDARYANSSSFCTLCHGGQAWFLQREATSGAGLWEP